MTRASDRVMVVTAHPDDPEFGAGGTIAKFAEEGREVTYVIVTNGNKGSADRAIEPERLTLIREAEQRNAAQALGVAGVEFLGYEDGEVEDTRQLRLVDTVVATWTLCTIPDTGRALHEIRRVLRRDGRLIFVAPCIQSAPGPLVDDTPAHVTGVDDRARG